MVRSPMATTRLHASMEAERAAAAGTTPDTAGDYTPEQRAADAERWRKADLQDDRAGWEDRRPRIATAFAER